MGLRPGYKQTDIGVIPEDWEAQPLPSVAWFQEGPGVRTQQFTRNGVKLLNGTNIYDGKIYLDRTDRHISIRQANGPYRHFLVDEFDIVIASSGITIEKFHEKIAIVRNHDLPLCMNTSTIRFKNVQEILSRSFLFHFLQSEIFKRQIGGQATGSAQLNFGPSHLKTIILPSPHLPEQRAIAAALSDVDAALAGLERLVTKKRDLKQAAMQQLLTGQTRLPGFNGDWAVKRLGDHVSFLRNGMHSRSQLTNNDPVRYLHYGDIHTASTIRLNPGATEMPRLPTTEAGRLSRLEIGDVVFVDASEDLDGVGKSLEIVGDGDLEIVAGQHTIAARFDKKTVADGFKGYLQFIPDFSAHLRRLAAGTKVYATNRSHIASAEIELPEPNEQVAIATALSDIGSEIAALEVQLDKMRMLKQAMMQALLTGRVRLPVDQDDTAVAMGEAANG